MNEPAFPYFYEVKDDRGKVKNYIYNTGLTKLEYLAALAMQGELACQKPDGGYRINLPEDAEYLTKRAFGIAEAMLKESERRQS